MHKGPHFLQFLDFT